MLKSFLILASGSGGAILLSILTNKAIAVIAGVEGMAVMGLLRGLGAWVKGVATLGFTTLLMRRISIAASRRDAVETIAGAGRLLIAQLAVVAVLAAVGAGPLADWLFGSGGGAGRRLVVTVVLAMTFVNLALDGALALLKGHGAAWAISSVHFATGATSLLAIVPLLTLGELGLAVNVGSGAVAGAAVGAWCLWRLYRPTLRELRGAAGWRVLREAAGSSAILSLLSIVLLGAPLAVRSLIGREWGLPVLGQFTAALLLVETLVDVLMSPVRTQILSGLGKNPEAAAGALLLKRLAALSLSVMTAAGLALILLSKPVLWLLFSDRFTAGALTLSVLCLSLPAQALAWCYHSLMLHKGRIGAMALLDPLWCLGWLGGVAAVAAFDGPPLAAAWAYTLSFTLNAAIYGVCVRRAYGKSLFDSEQRLAGLGCVALLAGAAGWVGLAGWGARAACAAAATVLALMLLARCPWRAWLGELLPSAADPPPTKTWLANQVRRVFMGRLLENLLAGLTRRGGNGGWAAHLVAGHHLYPCPSPRRAKWEGLEYRLDISRYEDWMVFFGFFDSPRDKLFALARPGFVVMDIGCNIGATLLPLAAATNPGGKTYGFEPDPENFAACAANIELNGLTGIELVPLALGDRRGTAALRKVASRNPAANRLVNETRPGDIMVRTVTLDEFVAERGLHRLDLIKIDVEGYELNVCRGAAATLRRFKPTLFVEVLDQHLRSQGASAEELLEFLRGLGYRLTEAVSGRSVNPGTPRDPRSLDVIARMDG